MVLDSPNRRTTIASSPRLRTLIKQRELRRACDPRLRPFRRHRDRPSDHRADQPRIGDSVRINVVEIENTSDETVRALVDLEVDFVKANGTTSTKVFKGGELGLAPDTRQAIRKSISLRQRTTRKHYPGSHSVRALINGVAVPLGSFELRASD